MFEPREYFINVFLNLKSGGIMTETNHTWLADVFEEIEGGYPDCQYLHTIIVRNTGRSKKREVASLCFEDEARA